tara:strand:+ start:49 stop:354 length:306 start_codon:yes stop_codon:yes gene_type:complete
MGPNDIKKDIYNVMTNSRELTNYCQESVKSVQSKKISDSLNNFHLKKAIDFIANSLTDEDRLFFESNEIEFDNRMELDNKPIFNRVIDYIENYLIDLNLLN